MTETIRQCWAFNRAGNRCDHPAGHPGNHAIETTWTDAECAGAPLPQAQPALSVTDMSPPPVPVATGKCVACSHAHRDGECKCGCYSFIG